MENDDISNEVAFTEEQDDIIETSLTLPEISDAVLFSSDWTTETIISQLNRGNIDIYPKFQRRDAWSIQKKSRFIESILLGLPIPQIVLAEERDTKGKFLVLDGKQRLLTLMQYSGNYKGKNNSFKLEDLNVRKDLIGKTFEEMSADPKYKNDINVFSNQTIRSIIIRNWPNFEYLNLVFVRLNTGSVILSPQELRQAEFPGPFVDYLDKASIDSKGIKQLLNIKEPDFRMRDVEILLRFISFQLLLSEYSGDMKAFLDLTCDKLNKDWTNKEAIIFEMVRQLEEAIDISFQIFGEKGIARKWIGNKFEGRLNRAILDVLLYYFANDSIRKNIRNKYSVVLTEYKKLCDSNEEFVKSIESTTKSIQAVGTRFETWGKIIKRLSRVDFQIPSLTETDGKLRIVGNGSTKAN